MAFFPDPKDLIKEKQRKDREVAQRDQIKQQTFQEHEQHLASIVAERESAIKEFYLKMQALKIPSDQGELYIVQMVYPFDNPNERPKTDMFGGTRMVGVNKTEVFRISKKHIDLDPDAPWAIGNKHDLSVFPHWESFVDTLKKRLASSLINRKGIK